MTGGAQDPTHPTAGESGPSLASALSAVTFARWFFVVASVLATLGARVQAQSIGLLLVVTLALGNLALRRRIRAARGQGELRQLAVASVLLDLAVTITWVGIETAGGTHGQMYLALGLVGVEASVFFGGAVTLAFLVAIMAILGGAEVAGHEFLGRRADLPVAITRVALLWSIVLVTRAILPGAWNRGGRGEPRSDAAIGAELKESAFQEVLDGAPSAILAADDSGALVMVNAAALRLFDRTHREMLGTDAVSLVPGLYEDLPHGSGARYLTREVTSAGQARSWEGIKRDGSTFRAEVSYSTIQLGRRVLVAASVRDITDRIRAEQERDAFKSQLEEAQRLESLGRLAGGIAHDFNNMLNVILNYTDFVEEATNSDPTIKADLGEIRAAGKRAARLTQQLLRLAGREALRPGPIDLAAEVHDMEGRLRSTLGPGTTLTVLIPNGLSPVLGDPTMINEVLGILVDNSAQAMTTGGEVTIEATEIQVTPELAARHPDLTSGRYVMVRVRDTGEGMTEETRARALEPFFTTRVALGGGLGLPTAYGLVRQSGGALVIDSNPGTGTSVEVYLPAAGDEASAAVGAAEPAGPSRRGRQAAARDLDMILLVDHDDAARTHTADILIRNNFQVVDARGGADALRFAVEEQARIKLVMLDRVMGSMVDTGLPEMLRSLLPNAKMVLMSTFSRSMLASQGLDDPSLPLMSKDLTEEDLLARVREVLR